MVLQPLEGFVLGLTAVTGCLSHCLPVAGPLLLASGLDGVRSALRVLLEFLLGRLAAYVAVGAALGASSSLLAPETAQRLSHLLYIPLGSLLLVHALRESPSSHRLCRWLSSNRRWVRTPLALGLLAGLVPCPPFVLAAASVFKLADSGTSGVGDALQGGLYFLFFFAGSSLVLLPLAAVGWAGRVDGIRRLGRSIAILAGLFFAFLGVESTFHPDTAMAPDLERYRSQLAEFLPQADSFSPVLLEGGVPYVEARVSRNSRQKTRGGTEKEVATQEVMAIIVLTTDLSTRRGYGGKVPLLLAVSPNGRLRSLWLLPDHQETPGYMREVAGGGFLGSFSGREANTVGQVDAVTGATVTSKAVIESVEDAHRRVVGSVLGLPQSDGPRRFAVSALQILDGCVLCLLFAVAMAGYWRKPILPGQLQLFHLRWITLGLSVGWLGLYRGLYVTGLDLGRVFTQRLPSLDAAPAWFLLAGLFLLSVILFGKLYCSWICPFGAVQELLYRLIPLRLPVSETMDRRARRIRPVLLLLWPLAVVLADNASVLSFEPLAAVFLSPVDIGMAALVLLGAVLLSSILVERLYCRYLCPVGALVDWLTPLRLIRSPQRCHGCYLGRPPCRYLSEQEEDYQTRTDRLRGDCIC